MHCDCFKFRNWSSTTYDNYYLWRIWFLSHCHGIVWNLVFGVIVQSYFQFMHFCKSFVKIKAKEQKYEISILARGQVKIKTLFLIFPIIIYDHRQWIAFNFLADHHILSPVLAWVWYSKRVYQREKQLHVVDHKFHYFASLNRLLQQKNMLHLRRFQS